MTKSARYLNEADVAELLDLAAIYSVVDSTMKAMAAGRVISGPKSGFHIADQNGDRFMASVSGCLLDQGIAGSKWFSACDDNTKRGLPRIPAAIVISDSITGMIKGFVDGTSLTAARTAALAVLSLKHCGNENPSKAAIVGFGAVGQFVLRFLKQELDVSRFAVTGSRFEKLQKSAAELQNSLGVQIDAVRSPCDAVRDADLVITATGLTRDDPVVFSPAIKSGATVCALGSFQEIDEALIARADRIFVDNWESCQHRGNLAPMVKAGRLTKNSIQSEIADVVAGKSIGRGSNGETVVIVLIGLGPLDIALAACALELAEIRGLGSLHRGETK
jgi:ornithine cyclodeaminase/alanine dehydrogenase-like protein (mu-crystallin family)